MHASETASATFGSTSAATPSRRAKSPTARRARGTDSGTAGKVSFSSPTPLRSLCGPGAADQIPVRRGASKGR